MPIRSFHDLDCYKNALVAISPTLKALERFPKHQQFALVDQIRRASMSVPANIAEGYGHKDNQNEFKRYLRIAMGSCNEVIAHMEIAAQAGYLDSDSCNQLVSQWTIVGKQLNRLIQTWRALEHSKRNL